MKKTILLPLLVVCLLCSCSSSKRLADSTVFSAEDSENPIEAFPRFEGGDHTDFRTWLMARVEYPVQLFQEYIDGFNLALEGRAVVVFIVEKDGSIKYIEIQSAPHREFGVALRQVIRRSPRWTPGYQNGEPVRVRYTLPVSFKLPEEQKRSLEEQRIRKMKAFR